MGMLKLSRKASYHVYRGGAGQRRSFFIGHALLVPRRGLTQKTSLEAAFHRGHDGIILCQFGCLDEVVRVIIDMQFVREVL